MDPVLEEEGMKFFVTRHTYLVEAEGLGTFQFFDDHSER